jgi:hypothetical protein
VEELDAFQTPPFADARLDLKLMSLGLSLVLKTDSLKVLVSSMRQKVYESRSRSHLQD